MRNQLDHKSSFEARSDQLIQDLSLTNDSLSNTQTGFRSNYESQSLDQSNILHMLFRSLESFEQLNSEMMTMFQQHNTSLKLLIQILDRQIKVQTSDLTLVPE